MKKIRFLKTQFPDKTPGGQAHQTTTAVLAEREIPAVLVEHTGYLTWLNQVPLVISKNGKRGWNITHRDTGLAISGDCYRYLEDCKTFISHLAYASWALEDTVKRHAENNPALVQAIKKFQEDMQPAPVG